MLFKSSIVCRGFILVLFCSSACVCWFVSLLIVFYLFTCVYLSFVCLCHSVSTSLCHRVIGTFPETIYMYFFFIILVLSCQSRVTVTSCFVYKVIKDLNC